MRNKDRNILAVNPGSRYLGLAVFLGTELRDWAVKVVEREKIENLISEYSRRYRITVFALKDIHPSRSSMTLREIVASIKSFAKAHGGCLYQYSINDVKGKVLMDQRKNKNHLMDEMASRYPFLLQEIEREESNKNPYLVRMFEAVSIGVSCLQEIDTDKEKVAQKKK